MAPGNYDSGGSHTDDTTPFTADYFYINAGTAATGGSWKIRFRTEWDDVIHSTPDIPYDATQTEICDILNAKVLEVGVTGWTVTPGRYQWDQTTNSSTGFPECVGICAISEIIASNDDHNPTIKPLTDGAGQNRLFTIAAGWPDRASIDDNISSLTKISFFYPYPAGHAPSDPIEPDLTNLVGTLAWDYTPRREYGHHTGTDFSIWADNDQYDPDIAEPYNVGHTIRFVQFIDGSSTTCSVFSSDSVAMAQAKFDDAFGNGKMVISSNGAGVTYQALGNWPEGSIADDLMYAGWFITYTDETLLAQDEVLIARYESQSASPLEITTRGRTGTDLTVDGYEAPRLGMSLYSHEGQGPSSVGGSCAVETVQDGSSDISSIIESDNVVYLAQEAHITPNPIGPEGNIANVTDVNFISSGVSDYHVSYSHLGSGVTVGQRLVTRTMNKKQATQFDPPRDHITGFGIDNIDEKDVVGYTGQKKDRLTISAYDDSPHPLNAITVMRSSDPGLVGINDIKNVAYAILPETIFNIQSTGETIARNTTLGGTHKASLQLLASDNNPLGVSSEGVELEYSVLTRRADMSLWKHGSSKIIISLDNDNKFVGIHTATPNELLTLSSGITGSAAISIQQQDVKPDTSTDEYGKVYVKEKVVPDQTQSLYFMDDGGHEFDLVHSSMDVTDGSLLYADDNKNTYAGRHTPDSRADVISQGQFKNTTLGHSALNQITTGDDNLAIGVDAGVAVEAGYGNLLIGNSAGESLVDGHKNIAIGHTALSNAADGLTNSIIIGGGDIGRGVDTDYTFMLGSDEDNVVLRGIMGPSVADRHLYVPKARFSVTSDQGVDKLTLGHDQDFFGSDKIASLIEKIDTVNDYPAGGVAFVFTGANDDENTLFTLRHHVAPMGNSCSYHVPSTERPVAELKGDLNLRGSIRFCDGTSMGSTTGIVILAGDGLRSELNTSLGNQEFHIDIEELADADSVSTVSDINSYLVISTDDVLGKINIADIGDHIEAGSPRIQDCDSGGGQNHVFTNTSTISSTNCYTNFFGYKAGHRSTNSDFTNFIGTEAGASETDSTIVDSCSYSNFMGYRAGWEASNADHSVFIGSSAGYRADDSRMSVFIGDSAGQFAGSARSIGIGDNALESVTGEYNIELTAGVGGSSRVIGGGEISNKIALGTCIAGDMSQKRISIGNAILAPTGVLDVIANAPTDTKLQTWWNDTEMVAYLDRDGNLYIKGNVYDNQTF